MLQFWKRSGRVARQRERAGSTPPSSPSTPGPQACGCADILASFDDEDVSELADRPQCSRLSKTLREVLSDKSALTYLIQYLEVHSGLPYVRCWLDVESFREDGRLLSPSCSRLDQDSDCDSCTADSNSLASDKDLSDSSCRGLRVSRCKTLVDEALRLFKKYVAPESPYPISCPDNLRNELVEAICTDSGALDSSCFDSIQKYVFEILEQKYFESYSRSHYNCKFQIDVLTSGTVTLSDILYHESILFYFMEFLEQEGASNLLEFWLTAINFERGSSDRTEAQNDAVVLYEKYFSLQATSPLGFGDRIRFLVEQNICGESGAKSDCFRDPVRVVEHVLDKNYFKPFLSSQLYFKYLSELISTVQTNGCTLPIRRLTSSDCSSEVSSNLLEDSSFRKSNPKSDMNISTTQLYDPDSLWRRRRRTRTLSFGRVTDLGRFETDVEPEPGRKSGSMLTRALKRVVNIEETKTKEEMAWQVAEMIVKDVTSVTLGDNNQSMHS